MDDFLHRLYRLTRSQNKIPREDFASLCLGRALERDPLLAKHIVDSIAEQASGAARTKLRDWLADPNRMLRCRTQVPAWTDDSNTCGRADLLLDLGVVRVVIEAKVGDAVPSREQLDRYAEAFEGALVVSLVEERVRANCPGPSLSWDDVLEGLCGTPADEHVRGDRHDLRRLFVDAGIGDVRKCLDDGAWKKARHLLSKYDGLITRLAECLIELGPNEEVRDRIRRALEDDDVLAEPTDGWGIGIWLSKAISDTRVGGLALGIAAGDFPGEISWQLEVRPTQELRGYLESAECWFPVRGGAGWFVTDLHVSTDGKLTRQDFKNVVAKGRAALREISRESGVDAWHTKGDGDAPYAPHDLPIAAIHDGIAAWDPVHDALERAAKEILLRALPAGDTEDSVTRHRGYWRTAADALPNEMRLWASVPFDLGSIDIEWENAPNGFDQHVVEACSENLEPLEDGVRIPLTESNWNSPAIVESLATALRIAVRATS